MYGFIFFFMISVSTYFANAMDPDVSSLQKIRHITLPSKASQGCNDFVIALYNQPLFTGRGSSAKKCKVLTLEEYDSRIVAILYKNVAEKLGKHNTVHCFGLGNHQLYNMKNKCLNYGITQWLYDSLQDNDAYMQVALESGHFKNTCDEVIKDLLSGWKQSSLIHNSDIFYKKSEEEWYLFIKFKRLVEEDLLMRLFFDVTQVNDCVKCDRTWKSGEVGYEFRDMLYLWIKKDSLNKVINIMGLSVEQS